MLALRLREPVPGLFNDPVVSPIGRVGGDNGPANAERLAAAEEEYGSPNPRPAYGRPAPLEPVELTSENCLVSEGDDERRDDLLVILVSS